MNIELSKIELVKLILNSNDAQLLNELHGILSRQSSKSDEFTSDQIQEIKLGLDQLDRGERVSFQEYMKKKAG